MKDPFSWSIYLINYVSSQVSQKGERAGKTDGKQQVHSFWCEKIICDDDTITIQGGNNDM
jgi:hypothetical protein